MSLGDLFFLASVLTVSTWCVLITISALGRRWETTRRSARMLGWFVAAYATTLILVALLLPRRFYAAGERRCFDDWCVAAMEAKIADGSTAVPCSGGGSGRDWIATIEVSSYAKRIRQRAPDARAELEDAQGRRYQPCAGPLPLGTGQPRRLSDELGPGESYDVYLPFRLPAAEAPAGLVMHHGDFPGILIIGEDHSLLHSPALQRLAVAQRQ